MSTVHRVYAKELETCTMASLQIRLWKNMDSLLRECETEEEYGEAYRAQSRENHDPAFFVRLSSTNVGEMVLVVQDMTGRVLMLMI